MQIFVRLQNGKMHTVDVNKDDSVADLKEKIFAITGLKEEQQRIIFAKKQLSDDQTLEDCHITAECTVMLIPIVPGGA